MCHSLIFLSLEIVTSWQTVFCSITPGVILGDCKMHSANLLLFRTHCPSLPTPAAHILIKTNTLTRKTLHDWLTFSFLRLLTLPTLLQSHRALFWPGTIPDLFLLQALALVFHLLGMFPSPQYPPAPRHYPVTPSGLYWEFRPE